MKCRSAQTCNASTAEGNVNDRRGKYFLCEFFDVHHIWSSARVIIEAGTVNCMHTHFHRVSSQCLAIITSLSASVRAFFCFYFLFFLFTSIFFTREYRARDIFSFSHELRVLSYSLCVYLSCKAASDRRLSLTQLWSRRWNENN